MTQTSSEIRAVAPQSLDGDDDDDTTAAGDTDHDFWDETTGEPIPAAWIAAGQTPPEKQDDGSYSVNLADNPEMGETGGTSSTLGYAWSGTNSASPPRDNLIRARLGKGVALRAAEGEPLGELYGMFSEYNTWYEVDSFWEGHFFERVLPGAFKDTIANDRSAMRVLFDHGMDPHLGGKPLGPIRDLEDTAEGPQYAVPLYDTSYNRDDLLPLLRGTLMSGEDAGSALGASMRFSVQEDQWNRSPKATKRNPDRIPERSIVRAKVYEFGPVTFPANAGATASARSLSDEWLARLVSDDRFSAEFAERVGEKVARRVLDSVPPELRDAMLSRAPAETRRVEQLRRRARALLATA